MKTCLGEHSTAAAAKLLLLLGLALTVSAHEDGSHMGTSAGVDMDMSLSKSLSNITMSNSTIAVPINYFRHPEYSYMMLIHIILMILSWVFVLPIGVMLSIARSRLSLPVQFIFLAMNAVGVLLAIIYNSSTPDLYPNNAHHSIGWIMTWIVCAQTCMALISAYTASTDKSTKTDEHAPFIPISSQTMAEHRWLNDSERGADYRFSNDSGQGTERNTESLRSQSSSSLAEDEREIMDDIHLKYEADEEAHGALNLMEKDKFSALKRLDSMLSKKIPSYVSSRVRGLLALLEAIITRTILLLGFLGLTTGIITYGGIFQGGEIFSGLAHFIKGGVFFWYGILTLGRWAGCFADLGWAWNMKPPASLVGIRKANMGSAEFVESFLIFFYGSTNVFLEHLAAWGQEWSAQDMEHISITIMFIGGGLCGMLIESTKIRDLLNFNITQASGSNSHSSFHRGEGEDVSWTPPKSYKFSMNPLPALVVLLLGTMMSSHHQKSMVSTMVHKQWGTLLVGASFARALTYVIFYLSPPTSLLPSRPPSELITAFCLMAGGVVFMASSHDTVSSMEYNDLNAMFAFTVTMGIVSLLMAWIILVIAVKGWALRKQGRSAM